jgi:hypothetical protein
MCNVLLDYSVLGVLVRLEKEERAVIFQLTLPLSASMCLQAGTLTIVSSVI